MRDFKTRKLLYPLISLALSGIAALTLLGVVLAQTSTSGSSLATLVAALVATQIGAAAAALWMTRREAASLFESFSGKLAATESEAAIAGDRLAESQGELAKSESRYAAVLNAIPDFIFRIDRRGNVLDRKPGAGAPPEELSGASLTEILPAPAAVRALELIERAIETGRMEQHEFEVDTGEQTRQYESRISPTGPGEAVCIVRDVTAQRRAERALRSAEEELRRILGSVSDMLWSAEYDAMNGWRLRYCSPVAEQITGNSADYLIESGIAGWLRYVHPDDRARIFSNFQKLIVDAADGSRQEFSYRIVRADSEIRWLRESVIVHRGESGQILCYGVVSDITENMRKDEALREATDRLRAVIEAAPLAIYDLDCAGKVRSWNATAESTFGWTEEEVLGQYPPFVPEAEIQDYLGRIERGKLGDTLSGLELRRKRKDGSWVDLSIWTALLRDENGEISGFMNVAADVTDRKLLEAQLRQSQKMEAVGRLAGGVAHDFNNLLTVITCYGQMLVDELEPGDSARTGIEEIMSAAERASALTGQLLAFSRKQITQPKLLDVNALVMNMDKMLRRVIGEHIDLANDLRDVPKVKADPGQLEQVIMNLVVNARDAMPGGGKITIRTARTTLDHYAVRHLSLMPDDYVVLSVQDDGTGMDAETKSHIFEPFFTTKGAGKGTGLGLSTVYGIVKQTGGDIAVESEPGEGSTFRIYLPVAGEAAGTEGESCCRDESLPGTETILLVEDDDEVRRLVHRVLSRSGYAVLEASRPGQALEISRRLKSRIHLLLADVVMPEMSGRQLSETLLAMRGEMRVLFMSGYSEDPILRQLLSDPKVAFIQKPFTPVALSRKIRQVLDQPALVPPQTGRHAQSPSLRTA